VLLVVPVLLAIQADVGQQVRALRRALGRRAGRLRLAVAVAGAILGAAAVALLAPVLEGGDPAPAAFRIVLGAVGIAAALALALFAARRRRSAP
ncbi:MAG: hypothetical protein KDE17_05195, partial [Rhodobacteraceae bacterium]|nr:hypothetical protein [Paracoccaceae bacterium]